MNKHAVLAGLIILCLTVGRAAGHVASQAVLDWVSFATVLNAGIWWQN